MSRLMSFGFFLLFRRTLAFKNCFKSTMYYFSHLKGNVTEYYVDVWSLIFLRHITCYKDVLNT